LSELIIDLTQTLTYIFLLSSQYPTSQQISIQLTANSSEPK